jgi:hypothetical protein
MVRRKMFRPVKDYDASAVNIKEENIGIISEVRC